MTTSPTNDIVRDGNVIFFNLHSISQWRSSACHSFNSTQLLPVFNLPLKCLGRYFLLGPHLGDNMASWILPLEVCEDMCLEILMLVYIFFHRTPACRRNGMNNVRPLRTCACINLQNINVLASSFKAKFNKQRQLSETLLTLFWTTICSYFVSTARKGPACETLCPSISLKFISPS